MASWQLFTELAVASGGYLPSREAVMELSTANHATYSID